MVKCSACIDGASVLCVSIFFSGYRLFCSLELTRNSVCPFLSLSLTVTMCMFTGSTGLVSFCGSVVL